MNVQQYLQHMNIPQVIGAIDDSHIPPADGYKNYIDRKG